MTSDVRAQYASSYHESDHRGISSTYNPTEVYINELIVFTDLHCRLNYNQFGGTCSACNFLCKPCYLRLYFSHSGVASFSMFGG